jgi:Na+/H+-translocating membrane pyrophosphatase
VFGELIATEQEGQVAIGFLIGAVVMALGGVAELQFGVKAAGSSSRASPSRCRRRRRAGSAGGRKHDRA